MSHKSLLAVAALGLFTLGGCAVHVHDGGDNGVSESCAVRCDAGGQARVTCEKPRIPACSCEPQVAAACISAHQARPPTIL